jgi:CheY-like chemotaxis protein
LAEILYVDDSNIQKKQLVNYLKGLGHNVKEADNGALALELINEDYLPDVIFSDVLMPEMDGFSLTAEIIKKGFNIPTILLSTHIHAAMEKKGKELGIISFVRKPFQFGELKESLDKALS